MRPVLTSAILGLLTVTIAAPALAYPYDYGYRGHRGYGGGVVIYDEPAPYGYYAPPPPVYYAPAPVYAQPAYAQPAPPPGYYAPPPPPQAVQCTNQINPFGALLGAAAGGLIGSTIGRGGGNAAAIAGGVVAGGALGASASVTQVCSPQVLTQVPVGTPVYWGNAQVVPTREFQADGRYCREYQSSVDVGGQQQQSHGTACRQPDGTWQIMN